MFWFALAIILLAAGALAVIFGGMAPDKKSALSWRAGGGIAVVLGILLYIISGLKSVPVKNIGVPQSFGSVGSGFYGPGIHETWQPWLHLTDINETIQTTTFQPDSNLPGTGQCNGSLPVRIGGQQQACAKVTIQWQVRPPAAGSLFGAYANQGDLMTVIENALVIRELELVVNQQVGDYDPITDYQNVVNTKSNNSQFTSFGPQILRTMRADIGSSILVKSVLFPYMAYSSQVEKKLQAIQQAYADFAIAQEQQQVSAAQNKAYANLGSPSAAALVSQCLSELKDSAVSLPAGFQCFPGASSTLALPGK